MIHRGNALWRPVDPPQVEWADGTLRSTVFGDIYCSAEDGLAESDYVFIGASRLAERFQQMVPGERFVVGELGFGTGLNFCLTLALWQRHRRPGARLHYVGIDAYPLNTRTLSDVASRWPAMAEPFGALHARWPPGLPGCHRRHFKEDQAILDLWWEPVANALEDMASHDTAWFDAWFLDGFAPAKNPAMWQPRVFAAMAALSRPQATLATFTAAGQVRRDLQAAGFEVAKRPGFGRKRECLVGVFAQRPERPRVLTPWDAAPATAPTSVLVIGAGLAGCHLARALAERGVAVTVVDQNDIAGGGSSNRQGITYTRLSHRFGNLSDFALASYGHALAHYQALFREGALRPGVDGDFCGYLQLTDDTALLEALTPLLLGHSDFAAVQHPEQGSQRVGVHVTSGGLWYPGAAWLYPGAVCRALLAHEGIVTLTGQGPIALSKDQNGWLATTAGGLCVAHAPIAVIAGGWGSCQFPALAELPLKVIRGQTSRIATVYPLQHLRAALCHRGYVAPAATAEEGHWIGATFGPNDDALDEREADHQHNLRELQAALPSLDEDLRVLGGHVALRCNSNDYLPVIGPLPDAAAFAEAYAPLASKRKAILDMPPPLLDGLWCVAGLGSRGLTAAPLAADMIAAQLLGEPPPLARYLQRAVSPARFLVRALARSTA